MAVGVSVCGEQVQEAGGRHFGRNEYMYLIVIIVSALAMR